MIGLRTRRPLNSKRQSKFHLKPVATPGCGGQDDGAPTPNLTGLLNRLRFAHRPMLADCPLLRNSGQLPN